MTPCLVGAWGYFMPGMGVEKAQQHWRNLIARYGALPVVAWADAAGAGPMGDWIWFPEGDPKRDAPVAPRYFRRIFELVGKATIRSAALRLTADNKFTVWLNFDPRPILVRRLKPGASYRVTMFDPVTGERASLPDSNTGAEGQWRCDPPGHGHDWVMLFEMQP